MFGCNKFNKFTVGYFTEEHKKLFFDSLNKKEDKLITEDHTLRLDHQDKLKEKVNLQIQYYDKPYANVILPTGYPIGREKLKELFHKSAAEQYKEERKKLIFFFILLNKHVDFFQYLFL